MIWDLILLVISLLFFMYLYTSYFFRLGYDSGHRVGYEEGFHEGFNQDYELKQLNKK